MSAVRRKRRAPVVWEVIALTFAGIATPVSSLAQQSGSTGAAIAGGALGLSSGATLAFVGSLVPCTQSRPGPTCVRWSAASGGALGLVGGAMLGASDSDHLSDVALGTGIGFAAGVAGGLVLKSAAERFGWQDVAVVGLVGGAIGAAPLGSAIGLLGGSAVGLATMALVDSFETPDLIGAAAAGLALGGIVEWLVRGIGAQGTDADEFYLSVPLSVGF
jgi:hypothetical protein